MFLPAVKVGSSTWEGGRTLNVHDAMNEQNAVVPQQGEHWYRLIAEAMPQLIFTAKPDGRVDYFNRQWMDYTGMSLDESRDGGWAKAIHPDDLPGLAAAWEGSVRSGSDHEFEFRLRRGSDASFRWYLGRAFPFRDEAGRIVQWVGTCTEIDGQKREEAELAKELERAVEQQRITTEALRLRDDFLSHVSHELRSPLASLASFSAIIMDGLAGETTEEQREYLAIIQKNVKQLESMIEDLLTVRSTQTGKLRICPRETSLAEAVQDAVQTCESKARAKGVELSRCITSGPGMAYADPTRLVQVLIILCDNAVKFTPPGGAVKVSSGRFAQDDAFLEVQVEDTGCGIKPELVDKVFDHLYQATDSPVGGRTGLGLGLYIARELVAQQGGRIWAESSLGVGSKFCFTVPAFPVRATLPADLAAA